MSALPKSKRMWVCGPCRARKTRCDGKKPSCSSCVIYEKECVYPEHSVNPRPHKRHRLSPKGVSHTPPRIPTENHPTSHSSSQESSFEAPHFRHNVNPSQTSPSSASTNTPAHLPKNTKKTSPQSPPTASLAANDTAVDLSDYVTVDDSGNVIVTGHTNTMYALPRNNPTHRHDQKEAASPTSPFKQDIPEYYISAELTANAAKAKQQESIDRARLLALGSVDGISSELILHLIDLYWSRHHFLHLVYRPAFMRELVPGLLQDPGFRPRYFSKLLFYTILAISARYSSREAVQDPHSAGAGSLFFDRAKGLLVNELGTCDIPTAAALLLLGNALVGLGQLDLAWLYTGMGIRILIHIGLHVDISNSAHLRNCSSEHVEVCRRVFWGAFLCEKLQSLYMGRPIAMHERDVQVPKIFLDTYEEFEIWTPPQDPLSKSPQPVSTYVGQPSYSISNFKALCGLAEICGQIISNFYAVKSTREPISQLIVARELIHRDLSIWEKSLPHHLSFKPWANPQTPVPPPHIVILHTLYYSLIILLERPFVADGHLRSVGQRNASECWKRCSVAAFRVAKLLEAYDGPFNLERAPYQLCYSAYVAATILVRNASAAMAAGGNITSFTTTLDHQNTPEERPAASTSSPSPDPDAYNEEDSIESFVPPLTPNNPRSQKQERRRVMSALRTCLLTFRKMRSWVYGADRLERIIMGLMARMDVVENEETEEEKVDDDHHHRHYHHQSRKDNANNNNLVNNSSQGEQASSRNGSQQLDNYSPSWIEDNRSTLWGSSAANTPDLHVDLETIFKSFNMPTSQDLSSSKLITSTSERDTDATTTSSLFNDTFLSDKAQLNSWNLPPQSNNSNNNIDKDANGNINGLRDSATSFSQVDIEPNKNQQQQQQQPPLQNFATSTPSMIASSSNRRAPDALHSSTLAYEIEMDQLYGFLIPSDENPLL